MELGLQNKELEEVSIEQSSSLIDYDVYVMSFKETVLYILLAASVLFAIGYIFYHNIILALFLTPFALLYPKRRTKDIIKKRKNELNLQFKDMLYSLSSSLTAGRSVEMSFKEALKDLSILYPDPDTYIIREVEYIIRKLEMNETVEDVLEDLARRAHLEDIQNFTDVFKTCKRTGGNLVNVIRNSTNIINDKIEIKEEINTLLAAKKFEQKILSVMPLIMIIILSVTTDDYMAPVFNTIIGRIVMTFAIIIIAVGYFISKKIIDIEI
ncbi:type II secretion system F family protein [Acetivibrio mesophilus]|uniref:Pilus assembly protein TadB n=1 Tax=Acetivibrio mesophilus TaxID=2487273 RepID=A0A4Q0I3D8_9FIRM|nr:type II secretion system F family protein [Acetivibrio mesophilus]ODM24865.1 pilus assembly protein TadB [Clostridium sp. Bc-iso-3]RXE58701.1 pilus assembly protein TadB [Acetivibrio mesophilus]HHV29392.1 pilus assembly protein TadB [Clostridium sp.]